MTTLFACFVDKHCYELRPVEASPVSDPCSGDLQELNLTRADLRRGHSHLHWASVRSMVCRPGRGRTRKKMLGTSAKQKWWEKHVQLLLSSPSQRRSYRRPSTPLLPFPQAKSRDCDARIFTRPAPRLVWSDAASVGSAPFFCRKKSTKNHWIAWQCTFKTSQPMYSIPCLHDRSVREFQSKCWLVVSDLVTTTDTEMDLRSRPSTSVLQWTHTT